MEAQDILFLEQNQHNFETIKLGGFVNNLHPTILSGYEAIYKKYLDKNYVLTPWCSSCVMAMLTHLMRLYDTISKPVYIATVPTIEVTNEQKKRGRPKK